MIEIGKHNYAMQLSQTLTTVRGTLVKKLHFNS